MKVSTCRCGARFTWARNTKGRWVALELSETDTGNRFTISKDVTPIAYSTTIGKGHAKHVCPEVEATEQQGSLDI